MPWRSVPGESVEFLILNSKFLWQKDSWNVQRFFIVCILEKETF
jgi:hypothetical protein